MLARGANGMDVPPPNMLVVLTFRCCRGRLKKREFAFAGMI